MTARCASVLTRPKPILCFANFFDLQDNVDRSLTQFGEVRLSKSPMLKSNGPEIPRCGKW
jgi:hypothetical protein